MKPVYRVGLAALLTAAATAWGGADWPHYLGPSYDGRPAAKAFTAKAAKQVWTKNVHTGLCSVTIVDGRLYTMGNTGKKGTPEAEDIVTCLDAATGGTLWTFSYPSKLEPRLYPGGPNATPTVADGKVYTLSKSGHLFCLDARSGKEVWSASASNLNPKGGWWGYAGSPTVVGDVVIYNVGDKGMALHRDTGKVVWSSQKPAVGYATVLPLPEGLLDRPAVAVQTNRGLHVLDPATGQPVATYERDWQEKSDCNGVTPYVEGKHLFVMFAAHGLARFSVEGKALKQDWLSVPARYGAYNWYTFTTPVRHQGHIYYLTRSKTASETGLACVAMATGEQKWRNNDYRFGNCIGVGDTLIMLDDQGTLIWGTLGDAAFTETYRSKVLDGLCWTVPVLVGDRLYVRNAQGKLVCLALE